MFREIRLRAAIKLDPHRTLPLFAPMLTHFAFAQSSRQARDKPLASLRDLSDSSELSEQLSLASKYVDSEVKDADRTGLKHVPIRLGSGIEDGLRVIVRPRSAELAEP